MKKRYSEQQIVYALKQSELGETAADICHTKKSGHFCKRFDIKELEAEFEPATSSLRVIF